MTTDDWIIHSRSVTPRGYLRNEIREIKVHIPTGIHHEHVTIGSNYQADWYWHDRTPTTHTNFQSCKDELDDWMNRTPETINSDRELNMTPKQIIDTLNRWAVIEYHVDTLM